VGAVVLLRDSTGQQGSLPRELPSFRQGQTIYLKTPGELSGIHINPFSGLFGLFA